MKEKIDIHNVTMISDGTIIEGNVNSKGNVRIDGTVRGNVIATGLVTQGVKSEIFGDIVATSCILGGKVEGNIACEGKLSIEAKALVRGDLKAKLLVVEEGALFNGSSDMQIS